MLPRFTLKTKTASPIVCALLFVCAADLRGITDQPNDARPVIAIVEEGQPSIIVPYQDGITVLQSLAFTGGVANCRGKDLFIFRSTGAIHLNLEAISSGRAEDVRLGPWDIIAIRRSAISR